MYSSRKRNILIAVIIAVIVLALGIAHTLSETGKRHRPGISVHVGSVLNGRVRH